ncbi:flavoprotein [Caballeronia sp. HLA56]
MKKILVGVTGSIGSKDAMLLFDQLCGRFAVRLLASMPSLAFFDVEQVKTICEVHTDESEWYTWKRREDRVLHIELRKWADILLVAPTTANTLSKFANGLCDNLLTTVFRAWQFREKPILVAPSMNKYMWEHLCTQEHLEKLRSWNDRIIEPRVKLLAGGDFGPAALADVPTIVAAVQSEAFPSSAS